MSERIETMLRAFFGLKTLPFLKPAATEEYLQTSSLTTGLDKLRYLVDRRGIGLLTGAPGTGKSTLLRAFISGLSKNTHCLSYIAHTTCCATDLLRLIAYGFDITPTHRRADCGRQIKDRILKLSRQNKIHPVLVIDEAHLLRGELLEELRIMTNFDGDAPGRSHAPPRWSSTNRIHSAPRRPRCPRTENHHPSPTQRLGSG